MSDELANKIKKLYTMYHDGRLTPEDALNLLEMIFANENEGI